MTTEVAGTLAWFHCFSGIAGDMALGALVDAGADLDEIRNICHHLPVGGWELEAEPVTRCGIAATKVHVHVKTDGLRTLALANDFGAIDASGARGFLSKGELTSPQLVELLGPP